MVQGSTHGIRSVMRFSKLSPSVLNVPNVHNVCYVTSIHLKISNGKNYANTGIHNQGKCNDSAVLN